MTQVRTRLGIDLEQHAVLRKTSPAYRSWLDKINPAVHNVVALVAIDEALTSWVASRIDLHHKHRPFGFEVLGLRTYSTVLHTPPARPGWLTTLKG